MIQGKIMGLLQDAEALGIQLHRVQLERRGPKLWRIPGTDEWVSIEKAVFGVYQQAGWLGYWREGGLILNLIKAMSFKELANRHRTTFIEAIYAQNVAFQEDLFPKDFLLNNVRRGTRQQVSKNAHLMLTPGADGKTILEFFPELTHEMFLQLLDVAGVDLLHQIAQKFAQRPYDYRAGWPDLTLWKDHELRFIEVKAPGDKLQASQIAIIKDLIQPLNLPFSLVVVEETTAIIQPVPRNHTPRISAVKTSQKKGRKAPFWVGLEHDLLNDPFWECDNLKHHRDTFQRLEDALSSPVIPNFADAMIAVRSLIREKRHAKADYQSELHYLYRIAAIESLGAEPPVKCNTTGYRILSIIPGDVIAEVDVDYRQLGYQKLPLLKKTDISWIIAAWGEPLQHASLRDVEYESWIRWEEYYIATADPVLPSEAVFVDDDFLVATDRLSTTLGQRQQQARTPLITVTPEELSSRTHLCSECGYPFWILATQCPQCGNERTANIVNTARQPKATSRTGCGYFIVAIILLTFLVFACMNITL